jgi:hypothetical protein
MPILPPDRPSEPSVPKLTPRQTEVMRWASGGWTIRGSHGLACEVKRQAGLQPGYNRRPGQAGVAEAGGAMGVGGR